MKRRGFLAGLFALPAVVKAMVEVKEIPLVVGPQTERQVLYGNPLFSGELGTWENIRFIRTYDDPKVVRVPPFKKRTNYT